MVLQKQTKILVNILIAIGFFSAIFLFAFRSCTQGYDQYSIYVQVNDESVFKDQLSPSDNRIVARGRKLTSEIKMMDEVIDNKSGPDSGELRWYQCGGIDCDEGWEGMFYGK